MNPEVFVLHLRNGKTFFTSFSEQSESQIPVTPRVALSSAYFNFFQVSISFGFLDDVSMIADVE